MIRRWSVALLVSLARLRAAETEPTTAQPALSPPCRAAAINVKGGAGLGNHIEGLTDLAAVASACGLPMLIQRAAPRHQASSPLELICSRLSCSNASWSRLHAEEFLADDIVRVEANHLHYTGRCVLRDPSCVERARDASVKSAALRALLRVNASAWRPRAPACVAAAGGGDDAALGADGFDVALHVRAITARFEGGDGGGAPAQQRARARDDALFDPGEWRALVEPLVAHIEREKLRRVVFIAANHARVRDELASRLRERGVATCAARAGAAELTHSKNRAAELARSAAASEPGGTPGAGGDAPAASIDASLSDWWMLAQARALVVQLGVECWGGDNDDCHDGAQRKLGWRSSFSSTAAVMRLVRTAGLSAQGLAFYDDYEHS